MAHKLRMTRARLIKEMSNIELLYWSRYFDRIRQAEELEQAKIGG